MTSFEQHFDAIIGRAPIGSIMGRAGYRHDLAARYSESNRWYHDKRHIVSVIERIYELSDPWMWSARDVALVAALYHDSVYVPGWSENERMSADFMELHLAGMGCASPQFIDDARNAILATKDHLADPNDRISQLLIDADLYELATERYECNERLIRQEFAHIPDDIYAGGRKRFLHSYLLRDPFYYLSGSGLEAAAFRNMENELVRLINGDGASEVYNLNPSEG